MDSVNVIEAFDLAVRMGLLFAVFWACLWLTEPWWGPISKRNEEMQKNEREEARQMAMKAMKHREKNRNPEDSHISAALSVELYNDFYKESLRRIRAERKPKPFAFHETIEGLNFIETAEGRSTSIEVMRGIAQTSDSLHEANSTWENGVLRKSLRQISLLVIAATLDNTLDWHKLKWDDETLFEVVTHGIVGQPRTQSNKTKDTLIKPEPES